MACTLIAARPVGDARRPSELPWLNIVLPDANAATSGSLQVLRLGRAAYIFFLPPFLPFDMRLFLPTAILAAGNPRTPPPGAVCV